MYNYSINQNNCYILIIPGFGMISHVIGTMSDKSVFGWIGSVYIKLLYFIKRMICKNVNIYFYLYYLQTIKRQIIIYYLPTVVSETLYSLLILFSRILKIILLNIILLNKLLYNFLNTFLYLLFFYFSYSINSFPFSFVSSFIVLSNKVVKNKLIKNKKKALYKIKDNPFKIQRRYYKKNYSQDKEGKEDKKSTRIGHIECLISKEYYMYKSYYEWLAGVIDVACVFTINHENKNTLKDISLDILLLRPHFRVLTTIWLNFGGSIKQISLLKKKGSQNKEGFILGNDIRSKICKLYGFLEGKPIIRKELDIPFCNYLYRYRLKKPEKLEVVFNNIYPLVQREYIRNIIFQLSNIIKSPNYLINDSEDIDLNTEWFAGVIDACAIIYCDRDKMTITLSNVCKKLLIRIREKFQNIGIIIDTEYYFNQEGQESRASWIIYSHKELLKFALFIQKYKLMSEIKYKVNLIEKWLYLQNVKQEYEDKNKVAEWTIMIDKFIKDEWYGLSKF